MKKRCLIIEDDKKAEDIAKLLLQSHYPNIELMGVARTIGAGKVLIESERPDFIICDINLPDGTAFDMLQGINSIDFNIIFTTAYARYAVEAFKFSALDYLLKPYTPEDFVDAVDKTLTYIDHQHKLQELDAFYHNMSVHDDTQKRIVLKSADFIEVVMLKDIVQAISDNNYTYFHLMDNRKILSSRPLKEFDIKLAPYQFIRTHQSYLVNSLHIQSFDKRQMTLRLSNNQKASVSQSKRNSLIQLFENM